MNSNTPTVMAALVAAIHHHDGASVFMDGRDKPGHDEERDSLTGTRR